MAWSLRAFDWATDAAKLTLLLVGSGHRQWAGVKRSIYLWRH